MTVKSMVVHSFSVRPCNGSDVLRVKKGKKTNKAFFYSLENRESRLQTFRRTSSASQARAPKARGIVVRDSLNRKEQRLDSLLVLLCATADAWEVGWCILSPFPRPPCSDNKTPKVKFCGLVACFPLHRKNGRNKNAGRLAVLDSSHIYIHTRVCSTR